MAIKGLTDTLEFGKGLPIIARLYKGSEKPENGKRPGTDLDCFRIEFAPQYRHLQAVWENLYGKEPTEFQGVFIAAPTVQEAFSTWREEWNASATLLHRCDGETQVQHYDKAANAYAKQPVSCASSCGCKSVGRLSLIFPEFMQMTGVLGVISVVTHSLNDILTLYRYLADIERLNSRLTGIPFVFGRARRKVSVPKDGKRILTDKSLFYLHVTPEFVTERFIPMLAMGTTVPMLTSNTVTSSEKVGGQPPVNTQQGEAPHVDSDGVILTPSPEDTENYLDEAAAPDPDVVLPVWLQAEDAHEKVKLVIGKIMQDLNLTPDVVESELNLLMGMTAPKELASWAGYETGAKAVEAVMAANQARINAMQPARPKKNPKYGDVHEWTRADIAKIQHACQQWWDDEMNTFLNEDVVMAALNTTMGWSATYKTMDAALEAIKGYAMKRNLPLIADDARYFVDGTTKYTQLGNGQLFVRLYSRESLRRLGATWAAMVDTWKDGDKDQLPQGLIVRWENKGSYCTVPKEDDAIRLVDTRLVAHQQTMATMHYIADLTGAGVQGELAKQDGVVIAG